MEVNFMQTQVKAWGNSQGIRLPKDILQEANVEINDMTINMLRRCQSLPHSSNQSWKFKEQSPLMSL